MRGRRLEAGPSDRYDATSAIGQKRPILSDRFWVIGSRKHMEYISVRREVRAAY